MSAHPLIDRDSEMSGYERPRFIRHGWRATPGNRFKHLGDMLRFDLVQWLAPIASNISVMRRSEYRSCDSHRFAAISDVTPGAPSKLIALGARVAHLWRECPD